MLAYLAGYRTELLVSSFLSGLAWGGLMIVFGGGLWTILRPAEGGSGVWSAIAFGGCVATAVSVLVVVTLAVALVHLAPGLDPASLPALYDASLVANLMTAFPNAVFVAATGIVVWRSSVLPRWVAWGAFAVAIAHLASSLALAREGAFAPSGALPSLAPIAQFLWLIGVGFALLRAPVGEEGAAAL